MQWNKKDIPQELVREIGEKYACDPLVASILVRRGIVKGEEIRYFLEDDPRYLHSPFDLAGMEDAVERVIAAKEEGEKVLVFGDRDVDGITSTAMVTSYLQKQGIDAIWRIPTGDDPYGLSVKAVEEFAAASGTLIITVDCGISNMAEVRRANELGIDVIITDHHTPQDEVPEALAIINPKLASSRYPFSGLAGCGVAYKFVSGLRFGQKSNLFGHQVCLFNTRPLNDAYIIEIVKLRNLSVIDRIAETVVPGMVDITQTRLPAFLEGQHILVWDARQQKIALSKIFGKGVEVQMYDMAPDIGKEIPQAAGKSLLRLKEVSRFARYSDTDLEELDVFINLFISFTQKQEQLWTAEDTEDLQLACFGTVADIMPLRGENRVIVRLGLASILKKPRPGIAELLFKLDLAGRNITAYDLSWTIGPCINSAGRMGSPEKAVQMLLETDPAKRERLAAELVAMNEERKRLGAESWAVVEPMAAKNLPDFDRKLAIAYSKDIFRGITGLMANKLVTCFKVPSMVVAFAGDVYTGSFRSDGDYNVLVFLKQLADLFIDWGGHTNAAGFSLKKQSWDQFLSRVKQLAPAIDLPAAQEEAVTVDAELPPSYLNPDILKIIDRFEPYGSANEQLIFMTRRVKVQDILFMGKNGANHVKLTLDTGKNKWTALYWSAAERVKRDFDINDSVDLVFRINRNWYNGTETPQLLVIDLQKTGNK
jgi:single-stranded-DNA-specific exonuclease